MKYIVLLRGVNISGKNKISMSELKKELEEKQYQNVITYLNSGNVIFECKKNGVQTVDFKAYVGLRHEILNESEWKAICDDLISWIS